MSGKFCAPVDVILCETKTAVQTLSVIGLRSDPVATSAVQVWLVIDTDERIEVTAKMRFRSARRMTMLTWRRTLTELRPGATADRA
jgi:hypothetical protein